jgi:GNAT superfamily N-acetyltransferase
LDPSWILMNISGEIRYFLGDGDYAHMKFSESKTAFSIDIVMVPSAYRNNGIGSVLIERVIVLADTMGKDIYISARPIGNLTDEKLNRLVDYYRRFGFDIVDKGLTVVYMVRQASLRMTDRTGYPALPVDGNG